MLNATRLCTESGRPATRCTQNHDGLGCTTGLYKLDGGIVGPVDRAVRRLIERSDEIGRNLDDGAYTDDLLRFVLAEAVRLGAVTLPEEMRA